MTLGDVQKPILRWAGSKLKLVPKIKSLVPSTYERYFEPFAGSACVFLALNPTKAVLSDINGELIRTYATIKKSPELVDEALNDLPKDKLLYYFLRSVHPQDLDPINRAARFLYLNRYSFNGVYRTNATGQFNVPMGSKTGRLPNLQMLLSFSERLKRVHLRSCDFETVINETKTEDFVYIDPPYVDPSKRFRGEYGYKTFTVQDEARLATNLQAASDRGVKILLSYTAAISPAFRGWSIQKINVKRSVSGFKNARVNVEEVLIFNY